MEKFKSFITEAKEEKYKVVVISAEQGEKAVTAKRMKEEADKLNYPVYVVPMDGTYTKFENGVRTIHEADDDKGFKINVNHTVIFDFINKLKVDSKKLTILGDGKQTKPYMHVDDLLSAIEIAMENHSGFDVYNVAGTGSTTVREIAMIVSEEMNLSPSFEFTGGKTGWKGDVPVYDFNTSKIKSLGWKETLNSTEAVRLATQQNLS